MLLSKDPEPLWAQLHEGQPRHSPAQHLRSLLPIPVHGAAPTHLHAPCCLSPPKWVATLGLGEGPLGHNLFQPDLGQCEHPWSGPSRSPHGLVRPFTNLHGPP